MYNICYTLIMKTALLIFLFLIGCSQENTKSLPDSGIYFAGPIGIKNYLSASLNQYVHHVSAEDLAIAIWDQKDMIPIQVDTTCLESFQVNKNATLLQVEAFIYMPCESNYAVQYDAGASDQEIGDMILNR